MNNFNTDSVYCDRQTKARYVFLKYGDILTGDVLDVGADQMFLKELLPADVKYTGIGFGNSPELLQQDLEQQHLPFSGASFDCVLSLDVLEHLENIHDVFDELCRVSRRWIIISLPNPYAELFSYFRQGKYLGGDKNMKFYGLPKEREPDRHKWFFSAVEAQTFVEYRAHKNGFHVYHYDAQHSKAMQHICAHHREHSFFRPGFDAQEIATGTMWWVLVKDDAG